MGRVNAPTPHRAAVKWLTDLGCAGRANRSVRFVESKAARVPWKSAVSYDTTRFSFEVANNLLVLHVQNPTGRQDPMPVRHERLVAPVVAPKFAEIVGVVLTRNK